MHIEILEREIKANKLELSNLTFAYLIAIKKRHPDLWTQFTQFVDTIENYGDDKNGN